MASAPGNFPNDPMPIPIHYCRTKVQDMRGGAGASHCPMFLQQYFPQMPLLNHMHCRHTLNPARQLIHNDRINYRKYLTDNNRRPIHGYNYNLPLRHFSLNILCAPV